MSIITTFIIAFLSSKFFVTCCFYQILKIICPISKLAKVYKNSFIVKSKTGLITHSHTTTFLKNRRSHHYDYNLEIV